MPFQQVSRMLYPTLYSIAELISPWFWGGRWREVLTRNLHPSKGTTASLRTLRLLTQNPHPATSSQPWSKAALWGQVYKLMEPPCGAPADADKE